MIKIEDFPYCKQIRSFYNELLGCEYGIYLCSISDINLNTPIFRYIKLSYLIDMLSENKLYVSKRGYFSDKRDARGAKINLSEYMNTFEFVNRLSKKEGERRKEKNRDIWEQFISCWTLKDREDYLMWKAYGYPETSCLIGTTIGKLVNSVSSLANDLIISSISYRSYNAKHISTLYGNVFEKTDFYSSEQEIRIVVLANKSNEKNQRNLQIPIDAKGMISSIIISPFISEKLQNFISEEMIISYPYLANKISKSLLMEY